MILVHVRKGGGRDTGKGRLHTHNGVSGIISMAERWAVRL